MRKTHLLALCLSSAFVVSSTADAHIALDSPSARSSSQKQGPCGTTGSVRGPAQTFAPGQTITVTWDETVDHVGHYRIAFDLDGDDDFPNPVTPDDNFPSVLVDQIVDRSGGGRYTQAVTLPDVECDNCTLQLMQIMTTNVPYNSFYYQCADIVLSNSAPGEADAGGDGTGSDAGGDSGGGGGGGGASTGGCNSSGSSSALAGLGLLAFSALAIRRRRAYARR